MCIEQLGSHCTDFNEIWHLSIFSKICEENSNLIKIGQEQQALYMKTNICFSSYLAQFYLEWKMFHTNVVLKILRILFSISCYNLGVTFWWNFSKHGRTHKGTLQWLHIMFVRVSCLLVLHRLHRLLVVLTGKYFPTSRSRTLPGIPLTPGLFFVRKSGLSLIFISRLTMSCLMTASQNKSWSRWTCLLQLHIIKLFTIARSMRK